MMLLALKQYKDVVWRHNTSLAVIMRRDKYIIMSSTEDPERRVSLRLPESLAIKIDKSIERSGMSFTEFLRRACREKLKRDEESGEFRENEQPYLSKNQIEALKHALQLPEIRKIILEIVENNTK